MEKNERSNLIAIGLILWQCFFSSATLFISFWGTGIIWFFAQILLGINLLQWFILHHDLIHGSLFRTKSLNVIFGHLTSIPSLLPFYSFKLAHHQHHIWTGWRDKDPSNPQMYLKKPAAWVVKVVNFCWKYWIPVMAPVFVIQNFWNIPRLFVRFPAAKDRRKILLSIFFVVFIYGVLFAWIPMFMLHHWLLGFGVFLFMSDLILVSQHTHIDGKFANDSDDVKAIRYAEQDRYARTILYPHWVSKYVFYYFDRHGLHHQKPGIPVYNLGKQPDQSTLKIHWYDWLRKAKSLTAYSMIYSSPRESGVEL